MIWNVDKLEILEHEVGAYLVSVQCKLINGVEIWIFSGVYGSVVWGQVDDFLNELDDIKVRWDSPWCIGGISI